MCCSSGWRRDDVPVHSPARPVCNPDRTDRTPVSCWIAFLRGINVGRAKRIAMADLRALCESLGHANVRTVLASGNVVFESRARSSAKLTAPFEAALERAHGFRASTVFITRDQLEAIVRANPLGEPADPARFLVALPCAVDALDSAAPLAATDWSPDRVAFTPDALYLDATTGLLDSPLVAAFMRMTRDRYTARNWATVQKVLDAARID
ncbi:MAG: DUF1697 domain-containing protein [Betaproteobacteria bacterium]|nr:DUF1697 domain-containing protein [Betaproteobacteria bacterium]